MSDEEKNKSAAAAAVTTASSSSSSTMTTAATTTAPTTPTGPPASPPVKKPPRRSPTTGHRKKKQEMIKRSHSSPREKIEPSSDDEDGGKFVRRNSLEEKPKKVLRRRVKAKLVDGKPAEEQPPSAAVVIVEAPPVKNAEEMPVVVKTITKKVVTKKIETISQPTVAFITTAVEEKLEKTPPAEVDNKQEEEEQQQQQPPVEVATSSSGYWWTRWLPSWSRKPPADEETKQPTIETAELIVVEKKLEETPLQLAALEVNEDENDLTSEFATLVSQTEQKILAEIESQIIREEDLVSSSKQSVVEKLPLIEGQQPSDDDQQRPPPTWTSWSQFMRETRIKFKHYKEEYPNEVETLKKLRNRCISELVIMIIFCGLGALLFKFVEGTFETFYKCGVKRVKRDFIDDLWRGSHHLREDEWKSKARHKLMHFENQLHEAFEAGMTTYSGRRSWSFLNALIYCLTVVTTIGYGHIAPVTTTGRALTIAYSIIGIPLFLILLADFGKLFTRSIKFVWAFVRRVYYTGSCKKVRRTAPVQEVMKGMQMVYDMALLRRPSQMQVDTEGNQAPPMTPVSPGEAPSTPALSAFAVDDEFNLPISVAIFILLIYIFMGATVFYIWETDWTFFDAFYFVFISMSTIGFGDLVPANQMYMMASIVYLAFGLALTSMCINVVQEKLSDTFRQASAKIGATIGLKVSEDDGTVEPASPTHVEIAEVHKSPSLPT